MVSKVNLATPAFNSANWNTPLNSNFDALNTAMGGSVSIPITTSNVILTDAQAQNFYINLSGTLTGNRILYLPNSVTGTWTINNGTSGAFTVTVQSDGGSVSGVVVTQGYSTVVSAVFSGGSVGVFSSVSDVVKKSGDTMVGNLALPANGLTVGTTQLYVSEGNVYTSGNFFASSNVTAYNTSDYRLKENIETLEASLYKVSKMRGVRFTSKKDGRNCIGVIAQEIQPIVPEIVEEGDDGYLYVAYGNLIGLLINAINELKDRVEALEKP